MRFELGVFHLASEPSVLDRSATCPSGGGSRRTPTLCFKKAAAHLLPKASRYCYNVRRLGHSLDFCIILKLHHASMLIYHALSSSISASKAILKFVQQFVVRLRCDALMRSCLLFKQKAKDGNGVRTPADHSLASIAIAQGVGQDQIVLFSLAGVKQEYSALFTRAEARFESRHFEEDVISEVCFPHDNISF